MKKERLFDINSLEINPLYISPTEKENGLLLLQNGATINTINMAHNMVYFVVVL